MVICTSCQTENPDRYLFCQACGSSLVNALADVKDDAMDNATEIELELELEFDLGTVCQGEDDITDIDYGGKSDVGKSRDRNEDDFVTIFQRMAIAGKSQINDRSYRGLFAVCDGMGGHEQGEVASAIAIDTMIEQFRPFWIDTLPSRNKIVEILHKLNQEIYQRNEASKKSDLGRMGTTIAMLAVHNEKVMIAHVGDSRVYRLTGATAKGRETLPKLEQLTRDHEVLNQLLDLGMPMEEAIARPDANQLTQALGPNHKARVEPDVQFLTITEPTLFLLCSDGLSDHDLIEQNWRSHLLPILNQQVELQTGLTQLIDLGNQLNGHDNITAIMVLFHFAKAGT